jgi:hypothetical protein
MYYDWILENEITGEWLESRTMTDDQAERLNKRLAGTGTKWYKDENDWDVMDYEGVEWLADIR